FGQNGMLSGQLMDEKNEFLSYANVALLNAADSALLTGTVTDEKGYFSLKSPAKGQYLIQWSAIGFANHTERLEIPTYDFQKNFGTITLKEDIQQLGEVKVQSLRPTIVNEVDKMVVSVEGSALAAGSTAFDLLSKAPGVWIDQDGNIQLNGKGGVRIMIDGRPTYLTEKQLQN